jgi:hypothetical protein
MESWSWLAYISPKYKMDLAGWVLSTLLVCKEINQKKKKKFNSCRISRAKNGRAKKSSL